MIIKLNICFFAKGTVTIVIVYQSALTWHASMSLSLTLSRGLPQLRLKRKKMAGYAPEHERSRFDRTGKLRMLHN